MSLPEPGSQGRPLSLSLQTGQGHSGAERVAELGGSGVHFTDGVWCWGGLVSFVIRMLDGVGFEAGLLVFVTVNIVY